MMLCTAHFPCASMKKHDCTMGSLCSKTYKWWETCCPVCWEASSASSTPAASLVCSRAYRRGGIWEGGKMPSSIFLALNRTEQTCHIKAGAARKTAERPLLVAVAKTEGPLVKGICGYAIKVALGDCATFFTKPAALHCDEQTSCRRHIWFLDCVIYVPHRHPSPSHAHYHLG